MSDLLSRDRLLFLGQFCFCCPVLLRRSGGILVLMFKCSMRKSGGHKLVGKNLLAGDNGEDQQKVGRSGVCRVVMMTGFESFNVQLYKQVNRFSVPRLTSHLF